jgi:hypothetical protein
MGNIMDLISTTLGTLRLLVASATLLIIGYGIAPAQNYTYFPTGNITDGQFLSLAGTNLRTVENDVISIMFALPGTATTLEIGIFDGETSGMWDQGTVPMEYKVYADPLGDNSGTLQIGSTVSGSAMPDNSWYTINVSTALTAKGADGNYYYVLRISNPQPQAADVWSNFKVRANNGVGISTRDFAFTGGLMDLANEASRAVIYPNWPSLTPTTYDGTWNLYLNLPQPQDELVIWDGDLDYGAVDCSTRDSDDPDTPNDTKPSWSASSIRYEGIAIGYPCTGGGSGYGSGDPPDNGFFPQFRRTPDITYSITFPNNGQTFLNADPTGNLEWEQFRISTEPFDRAVMDYHADAIPEGVYRLQVQGMDLGNLNAWKLNDECIAFIGVDINGNPVRPLSRCSTTTNSPGTGTPGYWRNHPEAWPVPSITIGGRTFTKQDAIKKIFDGKKHDRWLTLAMHTICAKLNLLVGNQGTCITSTLVSADAWLAQYWTTSTLGGGRGVSGNSAAWAVGEPISITLDNYNNGRLCAPHRDSGGLN